MEAAQWVAARMNEDMFDTAGFETWLAGDARRSQMFETMWRRIMGPSVDDALMAYGRQRQARRRVAIGATIGTLALLAGYQALPSIELHLAPARSYAAADGTIRTVDLDDGTQLTLAGTAQIQVRYTRYARDVKLVRGTIFANVRHDENRPFYVLAGDGRVRVLGTRFEVAMKPKSVRVTVEQGRVRFGRDQWFDTPLELGTAESASLGTKGVSRDLRDGHMATARWRAEWAEYDNAPLSHVIADLESVSPVPVVIESKGLADLRVNGRIRLTDPLRQIENLAILHGFRVRHGENSIILQRQ